MIFLLFHKNVFLLFFSNAFILLWISSILSRRYGVNEFYFTVIYWCYVSSFFSFSLYMYDFSANKNTLLWNIQHNIYLLTCAITYCWFCVRMHVLELNYLASVFFFCVYTFNDTHHWTHAYSQETIYKKNKLCYTRLSSIIQG